MSSAAVKESLKIDESQSMGMAKFSVDIPEGHIAIIEHNGNFTEIPTVPFTDSVVHFLKTVTMKNGCEIETNRGATVVEYKCSVLPKSLDKRSISKFPTFDINKMLERIQGTADNLAVILFGDGLVGINSLTTNIVAEGEEYELRFEFELK